MEGYQRTHLRSLAHELKPVVLVGDSGVTPEVLKAVDTALFDHELIKVRLRKPEDKSGDATALAEGTHSTVCGVVGHTVILYKRHPDKPVIHLPTRKAQ